MAASTVRRLCGLKVTGRLLNRTAPIKDLTCPVYTASILYQNGSEIDTTNSNKKTGENQVPDNLLCSAIQPKEPTKAQKISRAMQAYIDRAKAHESKMKEEIAEYEVGRRHLANIMGKDPELFDQDDINSAIEYLLPSGLSHIGARPLMKHPYEIFPKRKVAEFGMDGRPFHSLFYTGKPNFYNLLHDIAWKIEDLKKEQTKLERKGRLHEEADKKLNLHGSDWITVQSLKDMMLEAVGEHEHKHFVVLMERLVEQPLSYREEEFIVKYRRKLMVQMFAQDIPKPFVDENGRQYMKAEGARKSSRCEVTLWMKGSGKFTINGEDIEYFKDIVHREEVLTPLHFVGLLGKVDVKATVRKGGPTGKAGAIRLALSRALVSFVDTDTREKMRLAGLLTRDYRKRERKKPGQEKARKKFTWKKR